MALKYKIFIYFLVFSIIMLVVLWLMQIVFLDRVYYYTKVREIENAAKTLEKAIDEPTLSQTIDRLSAAGQICIEVADDSFRTISQGDNGICYSTGTAVACSIHNVRNLQTKYAAMTAARIQRKPSFTDLTATDLDHSSPGTFAAVSKDDPSLLQYVSYLQTDQGSGYYIIIVSKISAVSATVSTLRLLIIPVTILMLLVSLVLAWVLARYISKPITKITKSAEQLSQGEYQADFSGNEYAEIAQLGTSLSNAATQLSKVDRLKDELIANISHDLRTPLTMITGYAEIMRDIPGENTPQNVQIIIDEATRLTTLVNAVMDLSKIRSGTVPFQPKYIALTTLLQNVIGRYQKLVAEQGYKIILEQTESVHVFADEGQLQQVVYNLINNAISYCGDDRKVIIRQTRCGEQHQNVRIEVIDTGAGISKENISMIWERYYRDPKNHKRPTVGTGLGLSIVKGILEAHHAKYGVFSDDSPHHHGSDFWFELPIVTLQPSDSDESKEENVATTPTDQSH